MTAMGKVELRGALCIRLKKKIDIETTRLLLTQSKQGDLLISDLTIGTLYILFKTKLIRRNSY